MNAISRCEPYRNVDMPKIERTALVPHLARDMYALVLDVGRYPEFLPWCSGAAVQSQTDTAQQASVSINAVFSQTEFRTHNQLRADERIVMELEDGPFKHLRGEWVFKALGDAGCKITLVVDFEFSNAMMGRAISPVFTKVCDTLVDAFIQRANDTLNASS